MKNSPAECRQYLIETIINLIVPGLKFRQYGYAYPIHFCKMNAADVHRLVIEQQTETDRFGKIVNEIRKEFYTDRKEKHLVETLWSIFWWPAVDKVWPLQCFEVSANDESGEAYLYMMARTGPDEWIGIQTKKNYTPHD